MDILHIRCEGEASVPNSSLYAIVNYLPYLMMTGRQAETCRSE